MARWTIGVDTGGTFTDCIARAADGEIRRSKVPSSARLRATVVRIDAPLLEGASTRCRQRLLVKGLPAVPGGFWAGFEASPGSVPSDEPARFLIVASGAPDAHAIDHPHAEVTLTQLDIECASPGSEVMGEGSALEIWGPCGAPVLAARIALGRPLVQSLADAELRVGTTIGTNALLEGRAARVLLVTTAGHEDALVIGDQRRADIFALAPSRRPPLSVASAGIRERLAADGTVIVPVQASDIDAAASACIAHRCDAAAVALLHAGVNPAHELLVAEGLRARGVGLVVASHELAVSSAFLPRAQAAAVEAALAPVLGRFIRSIGADAPDTPLFLSASSGSPVPASDFRAKDSLLSGPATGVAAAARAAQACGHRLCVTLDVGGTSADAARATDGVPDVARITSVGGIELASPCIAVESVAAGGGSVIWHDGHALRVGPRSAGAHPGPACYGRGGPLTLTDAHLLLGRLDPTSMPIPIDAGAAEAAADALVAQLSRADRSGASATGYGDRSAVLQEAIALADESMAGAIRTALARAGESAANHALVAFGGAGGLHACAIADHLGMDTVILPADAGLLCATGAAGTSLRHAESRLVLAEVGGTGWHERLSSAVESATDAAHATLARWGVGSSGVGPASLSLRLRRAGQEESLVIELDPSLCEAASAEPQRRACAVALRDAFASAWRVRFGTPPDDRPLEVEQVTVEVSQAVDGSADATAPAQAAKAERVAGPGSVSRIGSTAWIASGWTAEPHPSGAMVVRRALLPQHALPRETALGTAMSTERIASALSAASAEMGEQLRRTALSVNVRDRLDFSCGILDVDAMLVANAPFIPVHLGALGACVRAVRAAVDIRPGDVWCVNHPLFGGAHLPDVTVLAPVHERDDPADPGAHLGFVAARAHHAEIGGTRPGSMPPDADTLAKEGVCIPPTLISRHGMDLSAQVDVLLRSGPHPSRSPSENMADLRAQVAALVCGRDAIRRIARRSGIHSLREAHASIRCASARAAREALASLAAPDVGIPRAHEVQLDDGTRLCVRIHRPSTETLELDFTGTAPSHRGNLNMPESVTRATILYVIRLLVAQDAGADGMGLPAAETLLDPVRITLPPGSVLAPDLALDPSASPAVAVGQTDTAQRLVDLLLHALGLAAESQGTMNNLLFGGPDWGFYETICGGAGGSIAGPGASAIHTHLTNTRITDVEVLERRHPVRVERFCVRRGSGGAGASPGGDGAVRAIRFLAPAAGSFLSQHRMSAPKGLAGGIDAHRGTQRLERHGGSHEALAGRASFDVHPGDLLVIETPGGGGFGRPGA